MLVLATTRSLSRKYAQPSLLTASLVASKRHAAEALLPQCPFPTISPSHGTFVSPVHVVVSTPVMPGKDDELCEIRYCTNRHSDPLASGMDFPADGLICRESGVYCISAVATKQGCAPSVNVIVSFEVVEHPGNCTRMPMEIDPVRYHAQTSVTASPLTPQFDSLGS